jgi:formate hydrogenlyase subunit 6/NADH:ubiquinone oxidoreductase subunit I
MKQYIRNVWLGFWTVIIGMRITFIHLFAKKVTTQYPDERYPIPDNARNRLKLDPALCNGCTSCARICPVSCIRVDTLRVVPDDPEKPMIADGSKRKLWVPVYDIDFAKCCFCGLCTTVCPTEAIRHTVEFEYSTYDRNELLYHFSDMSAEKVKTKEQMFAEFQAKEKAAKAEAAQKAALEKATEESQGNEG